LGGVALTKGYKIQVHAFSSFIFLLKLVLCFEQHPKSIKHFIKKKKIQDKC